MSQGISSSGTADLNALRHRIRRLEGFRSETGGGIPSGIEALDACLPGGAVPTGAIHEFLGERPEDAAAASGFFCALLSRFEKKGKGSLVWITRGRGIYAPGLLAYGICPDDVLFVRAGSDREALWAFEESLRCSSLAAVVCEAGDADLTATRRLQLAAGKSGVTGFFLCHAPRNATASQTRWRIRPAESLSPDGVPGPGDPCWRVELLRARGGRSGEWRVVWRNGRLSAIVPVQTGIRGPQVLTPRSAFVPELAMAG